MAQIVDAILAINSDAEVVIRGDDLDTCVIKWCNGTSEISKSDIESKMTELTNAEPMKELRKQRDVLLAETDYMGNSDVTLTDAWKTYRQALRDITDQTPSDTTLSNINWPTKPS
jgi:hypothetical protein